MWKSFTTLEATMGAWDNLNGAWKLHGECGESDSVLPRATLFL